MIYLIVVGLCTWVILCKISTEVGRRTLNFLVAIDQLIYVVITLGSGSPDETLSAAAWRTEQSGKIFGKVFRPVIDFLFSPLEKHHCFAAYMAEKNRRQLPIEYMR